MTRTSRLAVTVVSLLVFLPAIAQAHNFIPTDNSLVLQTSNIYRLPATGSWQLANLSDGRTVTTAVSFNNQIYAVGSNDTNDELLVSPNGLRFDPVAGLAPADSIAMKLASDQLIIASQTGNQISVSTIGNQGKLVKTTNSPISSLGQLDQLTDLKQQIFVYLTKNNQTELVQLVGSQWQTAATLDCPADQLTTAPQLIAHCSDGQIWQGTDLNHWTKLDELTTKLSLSAQLLAGVSQADSRSLTVITDKVILDFNLDSLLTNSIKQLAVVGDRLLVTDSAGTIFELLWQKQPAQLELITADSTAAVVNPSADSQLFINGKTSYFSPATDSWQTITTAGGFNHAKLTPTGWLIWQTDDSKQTGGLAQFAATNTSQFTKINPWSSTTSPIQALTIVANTAYLTVITQSGQGNVNLYQTTNYTSWQRLTLPTNPTYSVTIDQARQLPANALVETTGSITVAPGVVDTEALYIQDSRAGIQVFLSSDHGNLPAEIGRIITVTGTISSSQAKRIIVDTPNQITTGGQQPIEPTLLSTDQLATNLGKIGQLISQVTATSSDYLSLKTVSDDLKVHFDNPKQFFQTSDQIQLPVVVDLNSSSGKVEAWYLGSGAKLLQRLAAVATTSTTSKTNQPTKAISKKGVTATKKSTASSAPTKKTTGLPVISASTKVRPATDGVTVAGASYQTIASPLQLAVMTVISLLAGMMVVNGRRTRRWLSVNR